jgi:hypothetical protein
MQDWITVTTAVFTLHATAVYVLLLGAIGLVALALAARAHG